MQKPKEQHSSKLFSPWLDKMISMTRQYVGYMEPEKDVYEVLLDMYEEGMDSVTIDGIFAELKEGLIPLSRLEASRAQLTQQQAQAQERRQALAMAGGTSMAPNGAVSVSAPLSGRVLAQLVQAYQRFNLPTTLAALEVDINNRAELDRVIAHTLRPGESIHYLPVTLTPEVLRAAFEKVEYFSR